MTMTGPGRSPSSPWAQGAQTQTAQPVQGYSHEGRTPFHPMLSPNANFPATASLSERSSPNYFGLAVEGSNNPPTSNPAQHVQKNWTCPSPKLQRVSQESVSEGLVNLLRTESDFDKGRRESFLQRRPSAKDATTPVGRTETSSRMHGSVTGNGVVQQRTGSISQGKPICRHIYMVITLQRLTFCNCRHLFSYDTISLGLS